MADYQTWNIAITASGFVVACFFGWMLLLERKRYNASTAEVKRLAFHDALTDLPNRLLFMDRAAIAFAYSRRAGTSVAIAFLDLDRFKFVNDSFGHHVGDDVLRGVAERLRDCLREEDTVARIGGDEFTVVMPGLRNNDDVVKVATKIQDVFHRSLFIGGRDIVVSASIGISVYPEDGGDAETLLKNADAAMYRAKQRGGDNFQMYTSALNIHAAEELALESRLRLAIARQEFILHYQPRLDTATGRVVAFEALLRWNDPDRGLIMPNEFLRAAEISGLIVPIGEWVMRSACRQAKHWHDDGCRDLIVSVNLSARQFHRPDLSPMIREALRTSGLPPQFLELEIEESCIMGNTEFSMRILRELKSIGVRVLVAHFGAGYSSLRDLRRLPIDGLKLDRSFLANNGLDNRPLATAALGMAKALHLKVMGEGVETQEAADFLRSQSCDEIQGFLFSKAVPPQECDRFITFDGPREDEEPEPEHPS
ncbi:MAG TPA: EAL domain-containing protein [Thermoanaerobaculia bacterium]|jgi:diguanylate cyclase (GGDEF)-like protein|nr:EAL domain-containing protein [Thermoanaerobaculia bacterium]